MPLIFSTYVLNNTKLHKKGPPVEYPTVYYIYPDSDSAAQSSEKQDAEILTRDDISEEAERVLGVMDQVIGLLRNSDSFMNLGDNLRVGIEGFPRVLDTIPEGLFSIDTFDPMQERPSSILVVSVQDSEVNLRMYNKLEWGDRPSGPPKIHLPQAGGSMLSSWFFTNEPLTMGKIGDGRTSNTPLSVIFKTYPNDTYCISQKAIGVMDNYLQTIGSKTGQPKVR
jgi:hypothetical protein